MKGIEIVTVFQIVKICAHWSKVLFRVPPGVLIQMLMESMTGMIFVQGQQTV